MAASVFDLSNNAELRTLLAEEMRRQQFFGNRFAQWIGPEFVKKGGGREEAMTIGPDGMGWTGAPIEHVKAFVQKGRTDMLIPVRNRLVGRPVFGNNQLFGTGEAAAFGFRSVKINRSRKAYSPPTGMEEQKTRQWYTNLIGEAHSYLSTWWNDYFPSAIMAGLHYGYSQDLTAPLASGGRAQGIVSHPNLFAAGSGRVGFNAGGTDFATSGRPGTAAYELAVEAAVNGVNAGAGGSTCTVALIRNLVYEASRLKIVPIQTKNGYRFYPIWLKDSAWQQLQLDPEFQSLAKSLHISELSNHPLGNGADMRISGAAIYNDQMMWCARTNAIDSNVTSGTVNYGPVPTASDLAAGFYFGQTVGALDTGNVAVGFLIGQNCLSVGTGKEFRYTDQMFDHENVKEIGVEFIKSVVRNEQYDTLGICINPATGTLLTAADFYENTSSLAFLTYSPFKMKYN